MLDIETTNSLIIRAKNGDETAKETLITENSPLIKSVIKKYLKKGIEFDDLYQLGSLWFLKAINNLDDCVEMIQELKQFKWELTGSKRLPEKVNPRKYADEIKLKN